MRSSTDKGVIHIPLYSLAEKLIHVEQGVPFRLLSSYRDEDTGAMIRQDRRFLKLIFSVDDKYPKASRNMMLLTARQVGKSVSATIIGLLQQIAHPGYKALYVQPTWPQVQVISNNRYNSVMMSSPLLKKYWWNTKVTWQVKSRSLANGSYATFRSCYLDTVGIRGISADFLNIDEIQNISAQNIPIIQSCQDASRPDRKSTLMSGTPLSTMNIAYKMYKETTMFEWLVRCDYCNHWNYLDEKVIGPKFYQCTKPNCKRQIFPHDCSKGQWVPLNSRKLDTMWGFRIPQIIAPNKTHADLWGAMNDPTKPANVFRNEHLGLASDTGKSQITPNQLAVCCTNRMLMKPSEVRAQFGNINLFMGIDYGSGEMDKTEGGELALKAFTVVTVGGWINREFHIFYMEKFLGAKAELANQPDAIDKIARAYQVMWAGADWGFGAHVNSTLRTFKGWRNMGEAAGDGPVLLEYQTVSGSALQEITFNPNASHYNGRYRINRDWFVQKIIEGVHHVKIRFPKKEVMFNIPEKKLAFSTDFLGVYAEYDFIHNKIRYGHETPDDTFMAAGYAYISALQSVGELMPTSLPNSGESVAGYGDGVPYTD